MNSTERFMHELERRLVERAQDGGHPYVTTHEAAYMKRNNLYQPGHTRYRYSVPNEDLSDRAQEEGSHAHD